MDERELTEAEKVLRDRELAEVEVLFGKLTQKGFIVESITHVSQVYEAVGQPVCIDCVKKAADNIFVNDTFQKAMAHALVEELDRMKAEDEGCE